MKVWRVHRYGKFNKVLRLEEIESLLPLRPAESVPLSRTGCSPRLREGVAELRGEGFQIFRVRHASIAKRGRSDVGLVGVLG